MLLTFGRSRFTITCAVSPFVCRSASGFSDMNMKPALVLPRPPANAVTSCTARSCPTIAASASQPSLHLRKRNILLPLHLPTDASRVLLRKNPFGTRM